MSLAGKIIPNNVKSTEQDDHCNDGPLPVLNEVITTTSRVITPVTQIFSAIYRGPMTPCTTRGGPPCGGMSLINC